MATIEELKADSERKMTSALKALHTELAAIRTGRATPVSYTHLTLPTIYSV